MHAYAALKYLQSFMSKAEFRSFFFLAVAAAAGFVFLSVIGLTWAGRYCAWANSEVGVELWWLRITERKTQEQTCKQATMRDERPTTGLESGACIMRTQEQERVLYQTWHNEFIGCSTSWRDCTLCLTALLIYYTAFQLPGFNVHCASLVSSYRPQTKLQKG